MLMLALFFTVVFSLFAMAALMTSGRLFKISAAVCISSGVAAIVVLLYLLVSLFVQGK